MAQPLAPFHIGLGRPSILAMLSPKWIQPSRIDAAGALEPTNG
jgi:hypothetical protein